MKKIIGSTPEQMERATDYLLKVAPEKAHLHVLQEGTFFRVFVVFDGDLREITTYIGRITNNTTYDRCGRWFLKSYDTSNILLYAFNNLYNNNVAWGSEGFIYPNWEVSTF